MSTRDRRRPLDVMAQFRARLAAKLAPHGFEPRSKGNFVRRHGRSTDRIELSSSHSNAPGDVTCWVSLFVDDLDIRKREPTWRAGGSLASPASTEDPPNLAVRAQADALAARILSGLDFFALAADATRLLAEVRRRYVAGFVDPRIVVPYLLCRSGVDAVESYATALLVCRPELWPGFVGFPDSTAPPQQKLELDHGTELAAMLAKHASGLSLTPPPDTVRSTDLGGANLRCFFGRQLRAWGEPEAAAALRRVGDERLRSLRAAQQQLGPPIAQLEHVAIVLREVTSEPRPPRRSAPNPRLFQYHVLQPPFAKIRAN